MTKQRKSTLAVQIAARLTIITPLLVPGEFNVIIRTLVIVFIIITAC